MVASKAATVADYLAELPADRRVVIERVRDLVNEALPAGYREGMGWGMIGWVIPLADYPDTYNKQPLVYAGLAAQKNYNSLYLNCVYASKERTERLKSAAAAAGKPLDMGKSCIRFKKPEQIPMKLMGELASKMTPGKWIELYESMKR